MIKLKEDQKKYPLNPYEKGMYIENRLHPDSMMYNLRIYYEVKGASTERIKEVLEDMYRAHETFRSVYSEKDGVPFRTVSDEIPQITIEQVEDISRCAEMVRALDKPYDLTKGIPARAIIYTDGNTSVAAFLYHHIIFDGTGDMIFSREFLQRLYGRNVEPDAYDLSSCSLVDREAEYQRGFAKYKEMFADGVPVTELPLKKTRPEVHPLSDKEFKFRIDKNISLALKSLAREKNTTVFTLILSALSMTVAKYTAAEDVVIGLPVNSRDAAGRNVIGMFVNSAPLRLKPERNKKIDDYIREVNDTLTACVKQDHCPYDRLVAEFAGERDTSRNPLFDVAINYLHNPEMLGDGGIELRMSHELQPSGKDLNFTVVTGEDGMACTVQYSSQLFGDRIIEEMTRQLLSVTEAICNGAGTVREAMRLPEDQLKVLEEFAVKKRGEIPVKLLHKMFEASADAYPGRTALVACDRTMTYEELENEANRAANGLISRGFGRGQCAIVMLHRTSYFFPAVFGVLKAGGCFIPMDPSYPEERIRSVVEDSGASIIIMDTEEYCKTEEYPGHISITELIRSGNSTRPAVEVSPEDLAYMIYTSGSTGKPKGVMLRHIGICNYLTPDESNLQISFYGNAAQPLSSGGELKEPEVLPVSTYLSVTTVAFDMSFKEHCATLCNGRTLVFASDSAMNDPKQLAQLITENHVECMNATPSRLQQYLLVESFRNAIGNCRYVLSGGEGYPLSLLEKLREVAPDTRIINTYGPTEITVSSNAAELTNAEYISVGRPLYNYIEYIVDKYGDPAPLGVAGELYIGGPGVAAGYRNLPDKTAASFVEYKGIRMYRSGDLAKWDDKGNVLILGRLDSQIKLRGLRIELGEIENVIGSFEGINEAAAAVKKIGGSEHIAAYFTADRTIDTEELERYAASKLTHYMVPTAYMQLDKMPYTLNGKKDLRKLPEPEPAVRKPAEGAPRELTKFERELCGLAEKAIGAPVNDVTASLIASGLTSLTAIAFTTFVEDKYGCEIPVNKVMHGMSIVEAEDFIYDAVLKNGIAGHEVTGGDSAGEGTVPVQVTSGENETMAATAGEYPLSSNQLGVYYEVMKRPEELKYNMPLCYRFEDVDVERLRAALITAVAFHPYMNTHIGLQGGKLVQIRNDGAVPEIPVLEMTPDEFEEHRNEFVRPFKLHSDILYRFEIVETGGGVYLLSDIHHIIFDGISRGIFMDTVSKAYAGEKLRPEKLSYFEYAEEESREGAAGEEQSRETGSRFESEEYFSKLLENFETVSEIPADKQGKSEDGCIGLTEVLMEREPVEAFCRENAVTPSSLFLAAAFYTVSRFVNTRNVYISTISGGRSKSKIRGTVGMFVRTLPLHMSFDEDMNAGQLIEMSRQAMSSGIEHEDYPFMQLADKYGYSTEIMYECQLGVASSERKIGDAAYTTEYLKLETPKFKVTLAIEDRENGIAVSIRYNDAIYTEEYMNTLASSVRNVVLRLMEDRKAPVRHISLLDEKGQEEIERLGRSTEKRVMESPGRSVEEQVMESPGGEDSQDTYEPLLHKLFEKCAAKNPDRTAIIACDAALTYSELNNTANRIAYGLMDAGVNPRDSVVLLLPRRSFYFAALFGVLKAGAAFIPCDPEYPADRIRHIINDSGAAFIVTTEEHAKDYPAEQVMLIDRLMEVYSVHEDESSHDPETDEKAPDSAEAGGRNSSNDKDSQGNPAVDITGSDLAYMIYTSGSTGKPKGVMLTHKGICNFCITHPANILYQLVSEKIDTMLAVSSVSFDLSLKDTVGILCNGRTVVFASESQMNDPRELAALILNNHVDAMNATPSRYLQYMEYAPFREALKKLELVMAGGEAFPVSLLQKLKELGIPEIINTYGPTETTISCNMAFLQNADHIYVGRPLLNYSEHIVDMDGNPLPKGVVGELYIGGPGVARGYRNLDEQTTARFIDYRGERVYRSGDYAKWDPDGNVVILGRTDSQVKLRGLRIELGEIEGLIDKQPHIKKAVVVIRKLNGVDNLSAYYTADCEIKAEELKTELMKSLTPYMVPTAYLQLETMPVTPNGKTDLKALPDPVPVSAGVYEAPRNEREEYFCGLFRKVLKLDRVGATDSFFDIGGTSLMVTSVVIEAAEQGYEITYGDIFRKTTPRELAEMFSGASPDEGVRTVDFNDYDYSKINELLLHNNLQELCSGELREIGNILLTGATGFMGIHVLAHFLANEKGHAYCLMRKGRFDTAKRRLSSMLFYYFGSEMMEAFEERVTVYDGDVASYDSFVPFEELPVDTVFNCAANVKHFSSGTDIEDVNVGGAVNCVRFCEKKGARLIHFSTTSVSGTGVDGNVPAGAVLSEQTLYFGQRLDTKYTNSKLLSERVVLEAVAERGLDAKVIRVGTLSAREKDGEFQINFLTNNFMGRLRTFEILGCFPYSMINEPVCLGPIDESAEAFFALAKTPGQCCLFNCTNNHSIPLSDIIREMNNSGIKVDFVENRIFDERLAEAEKDPARAAIFSSLLAYRNMAHGRKTVPVRPVNDYTTQALAKMGFFWKQSSERYLLSFINALSSLDFFDSSNLHR